MPRARARARTACLDMAARACARRPRVITRGVGAARRSGLLMLRGCGRDRRGFNLCCIYYALGTRSTHVRHQPARGPVLSLPVRTWRSRARCWYPRLPVRVFVVPVGVCKCAHRPRVGVGTAFVRVCCVPVCLFLQRLRSLPLVFSNTRGRIQSAPRPNVTTSIVYVAARACLRLPRAPSCALAAYDCVRVLVDGARCAGVRSCVWGGGGGGGG